MKKRAEQLPIFSGIDRIDTAWEVRYFKGRTYFVRKFQDIREAFDYAEKELKATRDDVILSVSM